MTPVPLLQTASSGAAAAMTVALALSYLLVVASAGILLYYLTMFVRNVLAASYRERWWYLEIGVGAAAIYGVAGLLETLTTITAAAAFKTGATLFFFLFCAVGVRAMYHLERDGTALGASLPGWLTYVIIGGFIVAWWAAFLLGPPTAVALVETVGLAGATIYTLVYAVRTVRTQEGTSIAAVTRQFVPALLSFAVVVVAEQVGQYTAVGAGVVTGVELVGTVLVGAFLFTTAVAIRQEGGEVERMYDPTTWRQEELG